jgi:hypothetical protein
MNKLLLILAILVLTGCKPISSTIYYYDSFYDYPDERLRKVIHNEFFIERLNQLVGDE